MRYLKFGSISILKNLLWTHIRGVDCILYYTMDCIIYILQITDYILWPIYTIF